MHRIAAAYLDGRSTRRVSVEVSIGPAGVSILGDGIQRLVPWTEVEIGERTRHGPRRISFADGASIEAEDRAALDAALDAAGHGDSAAVRWQQSWTRTIAAFVLTVGVLTAGYLWGLPAFARLAAPLVPAEIEQTLGTQVMQQLDSSYFAPSQLPREHQERLSAAFARAVQTTLPEDRRPSYRLEFRKSKVGPNAFALPGGIIVMTDELVKIAGNDDAVLGVLAHELGHLHHDHVMRSLIQASALGAVAFVIWGDVSAVLSTVPTVVLHAGYSREAEYEADTYAIDFMNASGLRRAAVADMFEALRKRRGDDPLPEYLNSHPPTEERIERFRR